MADIKEIMARAVYSVLPNGGEVRVPSTEPGLKYRKEFKADTWEEAPCRHQICLAQADAALAALSAAGYVVLKAGAGAHLEKAIVALTKAHSTLVFDAIINGNGKQTEATAEALGSIAEAQLGIADFCAAVPSLGLLNPEADRG